MIKSGAVFDDHSKSCLNIEKNILAGKLFFDDSESFDDRDKYFGGKSVYSRSLKINYVVLMCFSSYLLTHRDGLVDRKY